MDTGHARAAGADNGEVIQRFGNRIVHIHLKDVRNIVLSSAFENDVSFSTAVREGVFTVPGIKVIEIHDLVEGICSDQACSPDFDFGTRNQEILEAIEQSSIFAAWVSTTGLSALGVG